jgi:hypothetical protein
MCIASTQLLLFFEYLSLLLKDTSIVVKIHTGRYLLLGTVVPLMVPATVGQSKPYRNHSSCHESPQVTGLGLVNNNDVSSK